MNFWDKIKTGWAFLTGDVADLAIIMVDIINEKVLANISNKETAILYLKDIQVIIEAVEAIISNHEDKMDEKKTEAGKSLIEALKALAMALEDFHITADEMKLLVGKVKEAIKAFKKA